MSIRLQLEGAGTAKTQLGEVAKGVYGIAAAEKAAETAAKKRVHAQGGGPNGSVHMNARAEHALVRSFGLQGPASHIAHAVMGTAGTSLALLGPAAAIAVAGIHAIIAVNEEHIKQLQEVNASVVKFREGLSQAAEAIGSKAYSRLSGLSEEKKQEVLAAGGPRAQMLLHAQSIQAATEGAEDRMIGYGETEARKKLGATISPGSAGLVAWEAEEQKKLDQLQIARDHENIFGHTLKYWTGKMGGAGNADQQYEKAVEAHAQAAEAQLEAARKMDAAISRLSGGAAY